MGGTSRATGPAEQRFAADGRAQPARGNSAGQRGARRPLNPAVRPRAGSTFSRVAPSYRCRAHLCLTEDPAMKRLSVFLALVCSLLVAGQVGADPPEATGVTVCNLGVLAPSGKVLFLPGT